MQQPVSCCATAARLQNATVTCSLVHVRDWILSDKTEALVVLVISSSRGVSMPQDSMIGMEDVKSVGIDFKRHDGGIESA